MGDDGPQHAQRVVLGEDAADIVQDVGVDVRISTHARRGKGPRSTLPTCPSCDLPNALRHRRGVTTGE